jgi:hypothetical protein
LWSSAGSARSQFASFLATKAHFSSNWTSVVRGGNRHEFVVGGFGVLAGDPAVAGDGVGVHPAEPAGLADAAPFGDVLQDRLDLLGREPGVEQGRTLALGKPGLAGLAPEHAARLPGTIAVGHGQVSGPPLAVVGAVGIQAAEAGKVVHGAGPSFDLLEYQPVATLTQR